MVKMDLERAGIPYKTYEGPTHVHAGGRHSHITGLFISGASNMEAKKPAGPAVIRRTAKYTRIGISARAFALVRLQYLRI